MTRPALHPIRPHLAEPVRAARLRRRWLTLSTFAAAAWACGLAPVQAQTPVTYGVAGIADFTGPYADVMKPLVGARRAVVTWWNEEVGKGLGVQLNLKDYDGRYDAAQVASLWPGIKSELSPLAVLGTGGPDIAALQQRLPVDKTVMFLTTASYGFAWRPDPWVLQGRATYPHEAAAFFNWYRQHKGITGPLKIGIIASEASPAYVDIQKGTDKYAKDNKDIVEVVESVFTEVQPNDLTTQVGRLVRKGAQLIYVPTNTAGVVATKRALQALGKKDVPILVSSHNGLINSGAAAGGLDQMSGDYEVYGMAAPVDDDGPSQQFFKMLGSKYKLNAPWTSATIQGMTQGLLAVRAIEATVRKQGATGLTSEKVREVVMSTPITSESTFGSLASLSYTNEAPFPLTGMTVNVSTVANGKLGVAASGVPVPTVNKW